LHIHSGLSPCADNDMSPENIVAMASLKGLNIIAVSDHNSIKNVKLTMELGKLMDILVVPAIELQTNEDIHILCLFETFQGLQDFYNSITFTKLENKIKVFGNQYIYHADDSITEEKTLLFASCDISESQVAKRAAFYNGIAIPAHIDRDSYGILAVLGGVPKGYRCLEMTRNAPKEMIEKYQDNHKLIFNSDAHNLHDIGKAQGSIELNELTTTHLISELYNF